MLASRQRSCTDFWPAPSPSPPQLRDRNSMLSVPGRSFRKVLTILSQAQREQQAAQRAAEHLRKTAPAKVGRRDGRGGGWMRGRCGGWRRGWFAVEAPAHRAPLPLHPPVPAAQPVLPVQPSGRYARETRQDARLKQLGAAELGVEIGFKPTGAPGAGVPPPPPPPGAAQQGAPPPPPRPAQPRPAAPPPRPAPRPGGGAQAAPKRQGTPIILVPPGMTALLNMYNVRSFLEAGEFKTTEQCKVSRRLVVGCGWAGRTQANVCEGCSAASSARDSSGGCGRAGTAGTRAQPALPGPPLHTAAGGGRGAQGAHHHRAHHWPQGARQVLCDGWVACTGLYWLV